MPLRPWYTIVAPFPMFVVVMVATPAMHANLGAFVVSLHACRTFVVAIDVVVVVVEAGPIDRWLRC